MLFRSVRNFNMKNRRPCRPSRSWRNKTGPGELSLTASPAAASKGESKRSRTSAARMSYRRLQANCHRRTASRWVSERWISTAVADLTELMDTSPFIVQRILNGRGKLKLHSHEPQNTKRRKLMSPKPQLVPVGSIEKPPSTDRCGKFPDKSTVIQYLRLKETESYHANIRVGRFAQRNREPPHPTLC